MFPILQEMSPDLRRRVDATRAARLAKEAEMKKQVAAQVRDPAVFHFISCVCFPFSHPHLFHINGTRSPSVTSDDLLALLVRTVSYSFSYCHSHYINTSELKRLRPFASGYLLYSSLPT